MADLPSLNLLELLGADGGCKHLLMICAYRQNEVPASHPLQLALDRMKNGGISIEEIALDILPREVVGEIVADTIDCTDERSQSLAALIYRKTAGNPFFINQLLKTLHDTRLVSYDYANRAWAWDVAQIDRIGITDNVVELMSGNIRKLPDAAQRLLKLAACIGNRSRCGSCP